MARRRMTASLIDFFSSIAVKNIEVVGVSEKSFEEAARAVVTRASKTVGASPAWMSSARPAQVKDAKVTEFRINLKIDFMVEG